MRISDWSSDVCSSDLPVLPQHNRIGGNGADLFDEASKVERHLWIGRAIIDIGRGDGLCLSELVDLDHPGRDRAARSEENTSELQSIMRISFAVFCLKKNNHK